MKNKTTKIQKEVSNVEYINKNDLVSNILDEVSNEKNTKVKNKHIINKLFNISLELFKELNNRKIDKIEMYKFNEYMNKMYNKMENKEIKIEFSTFYYLYNKSKYKNNYNVQEINDIKYIVINKRSDIK